MTRAKTVAKALIAVAGALALASCARSTQPDPLVQDGVAAYRNHSFGAALSDFDRALDRDPRNTQARFDRALTEERLNTVAAALADLQQVVAENPKWNAARMHLAVAEYRSRDYAEAARDFETIAQAHPKSVAAWLDDGVANYQMKNYAIARKSFAKSLELAPRSGRAHLWLGLAYLKLGDMQKGRNELALAAHSKDVHVRDAARRSLRARASASQA